MAKKMDFLDFVSDLPDDETDDAEARAQAVEELQGPIPPGVYFKVNGSEVVLIKDKGCKKKQ